MAATTWTSAWAFEVEMFMAKTRPKTASAAFFSIFWNPPTFIGTKPAGMKKSCLEDGGPLFEVDCVFQCVTPQSPRHDQTQIRLLCCTGAGYSAFNCDGD